MFRTLIAAVFTLACFAGPAFAGGISKGDFNRQIDQTNFLVNDNCSGTLIGPTLILTANHCIADHFQDVEREEVDKDGKVKKVKRRITKPGTVSQIQFVGVGESQRTVYIYKIKAHDPDHDLGLIQTISPLPDRTPAVLACREPERLDPVYAVGNPLAVLYSSVTTGIVASVQRDYRIVGIDGDAMHAVKFARLASAFAERCEQFQGLAIDDVHAVVFAVGQVDIFLLRIFRERDIPR